MRPRPITKKARHGNRMVAEENARGGNRGKLRKNRNRYGELVSNCPCLFLIVLAVVFVALVVVLVALEVVVEQVKIMASHYCYRC